MADILFISDTNTKFKALLGIADFLKTKGYSPSFYLDDLYHEIDFEKKLCEERNYQYFLSFRNSNYVNDTDFVLDKSSEVKLLIYRILAKFLFTFKLVIKFTHQINRTKQFLASQKFKALVCSEDNLGIELAFVAEANKAKIPTFIFPFTLANKEEYIFTLSKRNSSKLSGIKNLIFFSFFRKWKIENQDLSYSYFSANEVLARKITGLYPLEPYISIGGNSKYKIFESEFMLDYYKKSGLSPTNTSYIFGNLNFDKVHSSFKEEKNDQGKIILCSVPPDFYENSNYKSYTEMVNHWINTLASVEGYKVILSLHPRIKRADFPTISKTNVSIANRPIEDLIPEATVFVACISATIRLALLCKKRVLNFDIFEMNYSEYENIDDVVTVKSKDRFENELVVLCNDSEFKRNDDYYGKVDGKSGERIVNLIDSLCR